MNRIMSVRAAPRGRAGALVWRVALVAGSLGASPITGCSAPGPTPAAPVCDQACKDGTALRALRLTIKLGFNLALQGKPVGMQMANTPCPEGGSAKVSGTATSNSTQGTTDVDLVYLFDNCAYLQQQDVSAESYHFTFSGTITERGTLAAQSNATTALVFKSDAVSMAGTVSDPPLDYVAKDCPLVVTQNGNVVSGTICGRPASFTF